MLFDKIVMIKRLSIFKKQWCVKNIKYLGFKSLLITVWLTEEGALFSCPATAAKQQNTATRQSRLFVIFVVPRIIT
jgi:hypothetical protein